LAKQARSVAGEIERQDAAHVDVLVPDRRKPAHDRVGIIAWGLVDHRLEAMGVPCHDNVRQQGQGARDGTEFFHCAPMLCGDHAVVDGALQAVHCLALVEQIEDLQTKRGVAEIVAEIEGAEQPPQPRAIARRDTVSATIGRKICGISSPFGR